jgi:hypothetical protein
MRWDELAPLEERTRSRVYDFDSFEIRVDGVLLTTEHRLVFP